MTSYSCYMAPYTAQRNTNCSFVSLTDTILVTTLIPVTIIRQDGTTNLFLKYTFMTKGYTV